MFDKLIESNSVQAEFKPRRKFFMMSSVVVGILFLTAVVFSLYAQDLDLGTNDFELAELIAPVAPDAPEPEPAREQSETRNNQDQRTELPNRPERIARLTENVEPPETISTVPNPVPELPDSGKFTVDPGRPPTDGDGGNGPVGESRGTDGSRGAERVPTEVAKVVETPPLPPKVEVPKRPVSIGVANGKAIHLPKPPYTAAAIAMRAEGEVTVQVTIDEEGKVISAKAVNGHPILKGLSERAAWDARFTPTKLSNVPVKVTGIIVYRFSRTK